MGKSVHNDVLDAALDELATANSMTLCSAEPTTRTEAVTTHKLAAVTMTIGDGNGDYTIANGDTSGRKLTVTAQAGETVDASGDGTHIALCDATVLLFVTTCTTIAVVATGLVDFPAWDYEIADPS